MLTLATSQDPDTSRRVAEKRLLRLTGELVDVVVIVSAAIIIWLVVAPNEVAATVETATVVRIWFWVIWGRSRATVAR